MDQRPPASAYADVVGMTFAFGLSFVATKTALKGSTNPHTLTQDLKSGTIDDAEGIPRPQYGIRSEYE